MAAPSYLWHVGLGIGQGTREFRDHLSDADLDAIGAHIRRAQAAASGDPIPDRAGYAMSARVIAGVLLCTVGRLSDQAALVTFCVVTSERQAAKAWQGLHEGYPHYAASRGDVPRVPYCALRAEFGMALDPSAGDWIDAYQVGVAWAWLERRA